MEKVIRDGKVAVVYSPGYGAGWYTWNKDHKELIFSPKIVNMIESNRKSEMDEDWIKENLGIENMYASKNANLTIAWLDEGTAFTIDEYDGNESIEIIRDIELIA